MTNETEVARGTIQKTSEEVLKSPSTINNSTLITFLVIFVIIMLLIYLYKKFFKKS